MAIEFKLDDHSYNKLMDRVGFNGNGVLVKLSRVLIPIVICWGPLAIYSIFNQNLWTGNISTSFLTDFDLQAKLLIAMPLLIILDNLIGAKLSLIIDQFDNSGIIGKEIKASFETIVYDNLDFLRSHWTKIVILIICYIQLYIVFSYEIEHTSQLTWQMNVINGEASLNFAGYWNQLICAPFVLFLSYLWILRIIVWGRILYKISTLKITLFPMHPDLSGGLGFLGYSIRYFSPLAFAFSVIVAGNMTDFMLLEGLHLNDLRWFGLAYFLFITLIFSFPLLTFGGQLNNAREQSVFQNYDYINGLFRELRIKMAKGFDEVNPNDLTLPDYSAAADLSMLVDNSLKMKLVPFIFRDFVPLWLMAGIPFLGVLIIEIPINQLFQGLISFLFK